MITLDLPIHTEQMIIRSAAELGISIEEYVLLKISPELNSKNIHSDWQDFFAFRDRLYNEDPEEFETFELVRDNRLPQQRDWG